MEHEPRATVENKEARDNIVESSSANQDPVVSTSPTTPTVATDTLVQNPLSGLNEASSASLDMDVDTSIANADADGKRESSIKSLLVQSAADSGGNDNQHRGVVKDNRSTTSVPETENHNTLKPNSEGYISDSSLSGIKRLSHSSEKYLLTDEMKFMENFDPTQRMDRKRSKRYTESGVVIERCDCLIPTCPGCHFPCKHCGSNLCGHTCRKGREWDYEEIEIQGRRIIRRLTDNNEVK